MSPLDKARVRMKLRRNPFGSCRSLALELKSNVSGKTANRYLTKVKGSRKKATKMPDHDDEHKSLRLSGPKTTKDSHGTV